MTLAGIGDRVLGGRRTGRFAGGPRTAWLLAFGVYALGAVHLYLIPETGGLTSLVWNATLFELLTDTSFVHFVHIPLMQLPLAALYYRRAGSHSLPQVRLPGFARRLTVGPSLAFGGFVLLAVAVGLLTALGGTTPPAGAFGVLLGSFVWGAGWYLVFGLYLLYFPLVGLALLVGPTVSPGKPPTDR